MAEAMLPYVSLVHDDGSINEEAAVNQFGLTNHELTQFVSYEDSSSGEIVVQEGSVAQMLDSCSWVRNQVRLAFNKSGIDGVANKFRQFKEIDESGRFQGVDIADSTRELFLKKKLMLNPPLNP
jgi:hypothetical protein